MDVLPPRRCRCRVPTRCIPPHPQGIPPHVPEAEGTVNGARHLLHSCGKCCNRAQIRRLRGRQTHKRRARRPTRAGCLICCLWVGDTSTATAYPDVGGEMRHDSPRSREVSPPYPLSSPPCLYYGSVGLQPDQATGAGLTRWTSRCPVVCGGVAGRGEQS
jgi:hypothetical protein